MNECIFKAYFVGLSQERQFSAESDLPRLVRDLQFCAVNAQEKTNKDVRLVFWASINGVNTEVSVSPREAHFDLDSERVHYRP